jgi:hypothetical protein
VVRNASSAPRTPIYPPPSSSFGTPNVCSTPRRPLFGTHHNPGPSALIRDAFPPSPLSLCRIYKINVL